MILHRWKILLHRCDYLVESLDAEWILGRRVVYELCDCLWPDTRDFNQLWPIELADLVIAPLDDLLGHRRPDSIDLIEARTQAAPSLALPGLVRLAEIVRQDLEVMLDRIP